VVEAGWRIGEGGEVRATQCGAAWLTGGVRQQRGLVVSGMVREEERKAR
jgi:hypothetical protein